jgi:hypothetical protein
MVTFVQFERITVSDPPVRSQRRMSTFPLRASYLPCTSTQLEQNMETK